MVRTEKNRGGVKKHGTIIRNLFLLFPCSVFIFFVFASVYAVFLIKGDTLSGQSLLNMIQVRSPYIIMAFVNLILFFIICLSGARMYGKRRPANRRVYLTIGFTACVCTFLLHAMVYGIVLFIPVSYSLFGPSHITISVFSVAPNVAASLSGLKQILPDFLFIILDFLIHCAAPQFLTGMFVAAVAFHRARNRNI